MILIASHDQKLVNRWSRALQKKYELYFVNQKSSLLRSIGTIKPRVLLLDIDLPRLRVTKELPNIQDLSPPTKILVLSASPTTKEGIAVLKAGAKGYAGQMINAVQVEKAVTALIPESAVGVF
jgi:DNA-binding NarL/FixJ family response regulator